MGLYYEIQLFLKNVIKLIILVIIISGGLAYIVGVFL